jgi:hypothetical protein
MSRMWLLTRMMHPMQRMIAWCLSWRTTVALAWLGRGDGTIDDWDELRAEAARAHNKRTAAYLLGMPLLADHLDEALSQFDRSCDDFEMGHL